MPDFWGTSDYTYSGHNPTSTHMLVRLCVLRLGVENVDTNLLTHASSWLPLPRPWNSRASHLGQSEHRHEWRVFRAQGLSLPLKLAKGQKAPERRRGQWISCLWRFRILQGRGGSSRKPHAKRVQVVLLRLQASLPVQCQSVPLSTPDPAFFSDMSARSCPEHSPRLTASPWLAGPASSLWQHPVSLPAFLTWNQWIAGLPQDLVILTEVGNYLPASHTSG